MKGTPAQQSYALALLAGFASGLVSVSAAHGGSGAILAYLTPLPLVSVGLTHGRLKVLIAAAAATLLVALAANGAEAVLSAHLLLGSLPALVVVFLALTRSSVGRERLGEAKGETAAWYPPGSVVAWLTVVALVLTLVGCYALPTGEGRIETWIGYRVAHYIDETAPTASPEFRAITAKVWGAFLPALVGVGWLMLAVVNGLVGLWVAVKSGYSLRPSPDFLALTVPRWLLAPLVIAASIGIFAGGDAGYLARNAAALLLTPYVFLGMTVMHRVLRRRSDGGILLPLFYVVFFLLFGWAMVVLAGIGLVKQWTGLRRQDKADSQEEQ